MNNAERITDALSPLTPEEAEKMQAVDFARRASLDPETIAWLQIRADEAKLIDPATAETDWSYGIGDPYGIFPTPEEYCVGREYWARRPGSTIWVAFSDLPKAVCDALWNRDRSRLAFPAGLPRLETVPQP